jgi:copper resistance protein C
MKTSPFAAVVALVVTALFGVASAGPALAASAAGTRVAHVADQAGTEAHTRLKSSNPKRNAQVETVTRVTLVFNASVRFPAVVVLGAGEQRFDEGKPKVDGPKVTADVVDNLPPGKYTIAWRVVAQDGHPLEGEIPFTVVAASVTASPAQTVPGETDPTASAPATSAPADAPTEPAQEPVAQEDTDRGVPAWVWIGIFGVAGIGIGMAISMRKRP